MSRISCVYKYILNAKNLNVKLGYAENDIILFDIKKEYNLNDYIKRIIINGQRYQFQGNTLNDYILDYDKNIEYNVIIFFNNDINEIPDNFFRYAFNLIFIDLSLNDNIEKIGNYAFQFTLNLENIIFNERINYIGEHAFVFSNITYIDLSQLKQLTLKKSCFCNCRNINTIILPQNEIIELGDWSFAECFKCNDINKNAISDELLNNTIFWGLGSNEDVDNKDYSNEINIDSYHGYYIIDENHELQYGDIDRHFKLMKQDNNHFNYGGGKYFYDNTSNTLSLFGTSDAFGSGIYDELKYYDHNKFINIEIINN